MNEIFAKQLQTRANYLGIGNAAKLAEKAELSKERAEELLKGDEPSVVELYRLSISLEYNLGELVLMAGDEADIHFMCEAEVKKAIQNEDAEFIVTLFVNNKLVEYDGELYFSNFGKLTKKVSDETIYAMFDLLMSKGYVATVMARTTSKCNLGIKSIHDLDKYGDSVKDVYIYGVFERKLEDIEFKCVSLPRYFKYLVNSLSKEERESVMEEVERRLKLRNASIKECLANGAKLQLFDDTVSFGKEHCQIMIDKYDFSDIEGVDEIVESINKLQVELVNLAK